MTVLDRDDQHRRVRVYRMLTAAAMIWLTVRVLVVSGVDGRTPFLSANDRSRWCTVRSLVEEGTYRIDHVIRDPGWNTIDKVSHFGSDGEQHFFSSKPPLLATIVSGIYWPIYRLTGLSLSQHPFLVGRSVLFLFNGGLLALLFYASWHIIERQGTTDWGRLFAATVITWGTFLTTFAVTLNNHLPAAVGVACTIWLLLRIWDDQETNAKTYALAGLAAAMAAANELPCLSLLAVAAVGCLMRSFRWTLLAFVPAVLLVGAAFWGTNHLAHDSWAPPYAHRVAGEDWRADNWYNYEGSYWLPENRKGVDRGEPSRVKYAWHTSLGHHGVLSLSPVWLLSVWGGWLMFRRDRMCAIPWTVLTLTLTCWLFYLWRPLGDRNYAGLCCGFRWMFWLIPCWLLTLQPAVDWIAERPRGRRIAWLLLAVSAASALYGSFHPWVHPWPYALQLMLAG